MGEFVKIENGRREGICGLCPGGCSVEVEYKDGKLYKVSQSEKADYSAICIRGSKSADVIYSEDRLTKPLIRTGPKGTYEFREASWDEALEYAAEGFLKIKDKYGPQALASHYGRGAFDIQHKDFFSGIGENPYGGIFGNIGSPNSGSMGSLCYVAYGVIAPVPTMGIVSSMINADFENANTIFVWGTNPPAGSPPFTYQRIRAARKRGAKVITVDHYESIMTKNSDEFILVNSGTDGALILGLINYLIENETYDKGFVESYTYGFEELKTYVKGFSVERVIDICGIRKEDFLMIAEELVKEKVALLTYTGLEYSNCGVQTIRAIYSLWALAGHLDEKGGLILDKPRAELYRLKSQVQEPDPKPVGYDDFPLYCDLIGAMQFTRFPQAVLEEKPYKIAGLFNIGSVISINYPASEIYEEALSKLEMFVTADRFLTKDALYADVVLPATTHFEDYSYMTYPTMARIRERLVEPIGESRSNVGILRGLAEKMGFGHLYPRDAKEMIEWKFKGREDLLEAMRNNPLGAEKPKAQERTYRKYASGGLRKDAKAGFPTETGKFEFKSLLLESYGFDGLPKFDFAKEGRGNTPELAEKYPLVLNTGARIQSTFRTQHLNIESLVKLQDAPRIIMNSKDAEARGIETGDEVLVASPRGEIRVEAYVTDGINPGDTELNIGGGQDMQLGLWKDANANYLTDLYNQDPLSGFPVFKALLCEVTKA